jgi:CubicO group peptidase (beta-lactamase class C family)
VKPLSSFRSKYSYSNFGLTEAAVAAAKAAGMSWEDAPEAKLYKPLGMSSTSSRYEDFLTRSNRASLRATIDGKWQAAVKRDPDPQSPAGGVSSNARPGSVASARAR